MSDVVRDPIRNALVRVDFRLNLPLPVVERILSNSMLTPDDGSEAWYRSALSAIEAAVGDDLMQYLDYADEPDVAAREVKAGRAT